MIIDQEKLKDVWTLRSYDHHVHNVNIGRNFIFERKDLRFLRRLTQEMLQPKKLKRNK